ncbi:MAG TPA: DUF6600 domain-containing protein, partial [Thermoanaerobaculia bacterium]|nr:DUF6600 domain-containing protein [Thermoanaerobaculia bacterium]
MSSTKRILLSAALALATVATAFAQYEGASRPDSYRSDRGGERNGYSYVRETVGGVTVDSRWNGRVTARRNMPISAGDEILVSDAGRAEIGLADGNLLLVGGGTRARFSSLYAQQGEDDDFSAIDLREGSVVLAAMGYDEQSIPRIDTEDATVYLSAGTRVRVNADPRRGTVVVVRSGSAEVRTRLDSYTVEAGQYLMVEGDEPAEISRGVFSRDRFDLWAADRLDDLSVVTARSASARYVDDDYATDVVALDGYGEWEYSSTYATNVWVPRVSIDWTPYSYGTWYYTPIGLTWWSWDPWGWYPFHYGSWYFDVGFRHWCWAPAYTYSPAWVYWGYTPRYVGWCPVGYYSFYSPWYDTYYRDWGWNSRYGGGLMFNISGTFASKQIDLSGWNFVHSGSFGSGYDRINVYSGKQIATNLSDPIAISSKAIVVSSRGTPVSQSIQSYVKQAPSMIERTSKDSSRLAPILAREKVLPAATLDELRSRAVVADRGKVAGPGAEGFASRGMVVDRGRSVKEVLGSTRIEKGSGDGGAGSLRGRKAPDRVPRGETAREAPDVWRGKSIDRGERAPESGPAPSAGDWRGRGREIDQRGKPSREVAPAPSSGDWRGRGPAVEKGERSPREAAPREKGLDRPAPAPRTNEEWRGRGKSDAPPPQIERPKPAKPAAPEQSSQDWRRGDPPAKRVIEGAVPSRRWQDTGEAPRAKESAQSSDWRQRGVGQPAPAPREYRPEPRQYAPREYKPAPQPEYRPREYRPESRPQPAQEYRPAPRAPQYSAPPAAPRNDARPAPAPRNDGG